MSKRPLAYRHLIRLHDMVNTASIFRVVEEKGWLDHPVIGLGVASDRGSAEEILALAHDRGWSLPEPKPYAWKMWGTEADLRPRVVRILKRDLFELNGIRRETDDDDVSSVAGTMEEERRALLQELTSEDLQLTLPGAK